MRQGSLWWTCFSVTKPCLWPCGTPWTAVHLGSLYLTIPSRLLRLISLESCDTIQPSHLLSSSLTLLLSLHQGLLLAVDSLHQVAKYWRFSSSPCSEYSGLISFRIDWFDFLAAQGTLKSLLQHCVQPSSWSQLVTSIHDCWKKESFGYTEHCHESNISAF